MDEKGPLNEYLNSYLENLKKMGTAELSYIKDLDTRKIAVLFPFLKHPQCKQLANKHSELEKKLSQELESKSGHALYSYINKYIIEDTANIYEFLLTAILDILKRRREEEPSAQWLGVYLLGNFSVGLIQKEIEEIKKSETGLEYSLAIQMIVVQPFLEHPLYKQWLTKHNELVEELEAVIKQGAMSNEELVALMSRLKSPQVKSQVKSFEDIYPPAIQAAQRSDEYCHGLRKIIIGDICNTYDFLLTVVLDILKERPKGKI